MGDHLALIVDRLLTESTLEAAIKSRKQAQFGPVSPLLGQGTRKPESTNISNFSEVGPDRKLVECRICQEEDFDLNLEAPCSCCGSLKYAHRKCIQRWCNEKGDTTCEICLQQFKPGYTAPQHLFHYGSLPMNFRGSWEISRQEIQDSQVITMVPSDRDIIGEYDEYSTRTSSICCRSVAVIFMVLLILRHALPFLIGGAEYSFALFSLLVLRVAGVIFPIVVMARALMAFHRRRRQQLEAREEFSTSTDTEADRIRVQTRIIQLH